MSETNTDGQSGSESAIEIHVVQPGENLTQIAQLFSQKAGHELGAEAVHEFAIRIGARNGLEAPYILHPGQELKIPLLLAQPSESQNQPPAQQPICIGSIIHLQSGLENELENGPENGGYLDVGGWVMDKPVVSAYLEPRIRKFVSTHQSANRSVGSGSWLILSATGKAEGEPLMVGDEIHLLNMQPGSGYLDCFELVDRLKSLEAFSPPMTLGVFATSTAKSDENATGVWTVSSAVKSQGGQGEAGVEIAGEEIGGVEILEGDVICFKHNYPVAGFLWAYGDVASQPLYYDDAGQQKFVFTGPAEEQQGGSRHWVVSLSSLTESIYHIQDQQGDDSSPSHEEGILVLGQALEEPVTSLHLAAHDIAHDGPSSSLSGTVTYRGGAPEEIRLDVVRTSPNVYANIYAKEGRQWLLGWRTHQTVTALSIDSPDDGRTVEGTITYAGEGPIRFRAERGFANASHAHALLSQLLQPDWLREQVIRLEKTISDTHRLLSQVFQEMSGHALEPVMQRIYADNGVDAAQIRNVWNGAESGGHSEATAPLDLNFQNEQLLNLCLFSHSLNAFFRYTLLELIQHALHTGGHAAHESFAPMPLFRACFAQIAAEQARLQAAVRQRRWDSAQKANYLGTQAVELLILDKLAIRCVAPFHALLAEETEQVAIITHLSERTHIHTMPYTREFMWIGISPDRATPAASLFTDQNFIGNHFYAFELMALPHEVAHYMWKNGRIDGRTFPERSEKFRENPYYRWCEEIFADVYSCIVAGPLAAISMQALLMSIDRERVWKDDEEHPTPVLRIFILTDILRTLGQLQDAYHFPKIAARLDAEWTQILAQWGYDVMEEREGRPVRLYLHDPSALHLESIINVERVMKTIQPIIQEFATCLLNVVFPEGHTTEQVAQHIPWTREDRSSDEPYGDIIYNIEMARLINVNTAQGELPPCCLLNTAPLQAQDAHADPNRKLRQLLAGWEDDGPIPKGGSGGGG